MEKTVPFIEKTLVAETVAKNNISIFNDEGDPQKSWWKPQIWRATVAYPALVARSISVICVNNGAKLFIEVSISHGDFLNFGHRFIKFREIVGRSVYEKSNSTLYTYKT